jgi:hypothetical protein
MAKAKIWGDWDPERNKGVVAIKCPGCRCNHIIATKEPFENGAVWQFNGDFDKPTFQPSLLVKTGSYASPSYVDDPEIPPVICHSFITDGRIQFLGDCTHELRGQTVDLPEI